MEAQGRTATGGTGGEGTGRVLLTVVVPTRNEADNVADLVRGLREGLAGVEFRVVFVDDSTDGTPGVIRGLAEDDGRGARVHRAGRRRAGGCGVGEGAGGGRRAGGARPPRGRRAGGRPLDGGDHRDRAVLPEE